MNCASHKQASTQLRPSSEGPNGLYAELANGLHAMAQPLTILRGALGAMVLSSPVAPGQERYLEMSNKQMDRLCDMMADLQGLLDAALYEAQCTATDIWETAEPVLDDMSTFLQDAGMRIEIIRPAQPISAIADASRLEQAIRAALKTAASVSQRDDVIQFEIVPSDDSVELRVQTQGPPGKRLGSTDRLSLALVEANTNSQLGTYLFSEDPLRISIKLPIQARQQRSPEVNFPCSTVQHPGSALQRLH
jgi:hypothetical protein